MRTDCSLRCVERGATEQRDRSSANLVRYFVVESPVSRGGAPDVRRRRRCRIGRRLRRWLRRGFGRWRRRRLRRGVGRRRRRRAGRLRRRIGRRLRRRLRCRSGNTVVTEPIPLIPVKAGVQRVRAAVGGAAVIKRKAHLAGWTSRPNHVLETDVRPTLQTTSRQLSPAADSQCPCPSFCASNHVARRRQSRASRPSPAVART